MKRLALFVWLLLALPAAAQDIENPEYLRRAAWGLAKEGSGRSLYLFLENQFPTFTGLAEKSGLPEVLDGAMLPAAFQSEFSQRLSSYAPTGDQPSAKAMQSLCDALHSVLTTFAFQPVPAGRSVRSFVQNRGPPDGLLADLYDVDDHVLKNWAKLKTIAVTSVPGDLVWFNPDLAIPELGIQPGVPLTDVQKALVVKLFSVRVTSDPKATIGEAVYPSDVGRSVNPRSGVLTIVDGNDGKLLPDLTIKGTGVNQAPKPTTTNLEVGEAIFDSEVSLSLMRKGVRIYVPVAVIADPASPGMGVSVRASTTMLRHSHLAQFGSWTNATLAEVELLLEKIRNNGTLVDGREFDLREWVADVLPRLTGRNAGTMRGLGILHGSTTQSNIGVGEQVDFGEPSLGNAPSDAQKDWHRQALENITKAANLVLPDGRKVDLNASRALFDAEYASAAARVTEERMRLGVTAESVALMDPSHRRRLYDGYLDSLDTMSEEQLRLELVRLALEKPETARTMSSAQARGKIKDAFKGKDGAKLDSLLRLLGATESGARETELRGEPLSRLRAMAREQGVLQPERFNRSQLARLIGGSGLSARPMASPDRTSGLRSAARTAAHAAAGLGVFAAGLIVKETVQGLVSGDPRRIMDAWKETKSPWFAGGFAVFSGTEAATAKLLGTPKGMWGAAARFALPLYAGVSILNVAQGKRDMKSIASEATSFGVAALALQPVMHAVRGALYPALAASGPAGWAGIGAIEVANAATMLWGAEKIAPAVDRTIAGAGALGKKTVNAISKLKFW